MDKQKDQVRYSLKKCKTEKLYIFYLHVMSFPIPELADFCLRQLCMTTGRGEKGGVDIVQ